MPSSFWHAVLVHAQHVWQEDPINALALGVCLVVFWGFLAMPILSLFTTYTSGDQS